MRPHSHGRVMLIAAMFWLAIGAQAQVGVLTWHNDNARTGQNLQETLLTPANVNSSQFGKLFVISVDGLVDAQPLYVPALSIPGQGVHNVLYVVTENDSAYAFDADVGTQLWHVNLAETNETASDDRGCGQVAPTIGITSTPAIDLGVGPHGTMYAVAMSKDNSGGYHHRLHALDLTTGAEEFSGPKEVQATYNWTGSGSRSGTVTFDPKQYKERPALLISNGVVYTSWSSHCDAGPYTGWVMGYNETTLNQVSVLDLTSNLGSSSGGFGAIWMAGSGPAADGNGNIYLLTANGVFDNTLSNGFPENNDYGNSFVKMSTAGGNLMVTDYFTMDNTTSESNGDIDLGSGGLMLLPPLSGTSGSVSLVIGAGKDHNVYVLNQGNLGKFSSSADNIYQQMSDVTPGGVWSSPAWFNGRLYYGDVGDFLKAYTFSGGQFSTTPSSQSAVRFGYPGTTPSISANGSSNGIVWAMESVVGLSSILYAFDASNLATELYDSNQAANSRDQFGSGNKYMVPMIANGKVYVGATPDNTHGSVGVFGFLPVAASAAPNSGTGAVQTFTFSFSDAAGATNLLASRVLFNTTLSGTSACFVYFSGGGANTLYLLSDAGALQGGIPIGSAGTLSNSQCSVNVGASSAVFSGSILTLNLAITFTPAFAGAKKIYSEAQNVSVLGAWSQMGTWTVTGAPSPPAAVSVAPSSGSGWSQTFVATFSDGAGASDILATRVLINSSFSGTNGCFLYFYRGGANMLYLLSDAGALQPGITIGTSGTLSNSQCTINAGASSAMSSGNTLTLTLAVTFTAAFAGAKNVLMEAQSATVLGSWAQTGTWTVPGSSSPPAPVSVTPNSGSGTSQTFSAVFSD